MSLAGPVFNTTHAGGNAQINNINGNVYMLSEEKEIYKWLIAPDSSGNYLAARAKHYENTGTWFIEGEEYIKWKETPDSALWVYGTPGCGKTIICSTVIEEIVEECAAQPMVASAYFFFDNRNAQTELSLHDRLIRSIIKQLSYQSTGVPAPLTELYGGGKQQPSIESLQHTLQKIIDGFERTYIVVDALDECTDRDKVITWIADLMRRKAGNIHVLVSSRREIEIEEKFETIKALDRVSLTGNRADADIKVYLDAMLSRMIRWDTQIKARVRDVLLAGADGMFRWVALQIAELSKCRTRRAVEIQLQALPKGLDEIYESALLRIPHPDRYDLKQFLTWVAFSSRPLEPEELADVVAVDFSSNDRPSYDANLRYFGPADMLITCSSFVTEIEVEKMRVFGDTPLVRVMKLAHMSVKDYLVSDRLKNGPASYFSINAMLAHSLITRTCLAYLFHLGSLHYFNDSVLESFPLGTYAAKYWIKHMRLGGGEIEHLSQMMDCIFSLKNSALANWVRLDDPDQPEWHPSRTNYGKQSSEIALPLYYACTNGLQLIAQRLLTGGTMVNTPGRLHGNTLQAASLEGHNVIVGLLPEHGADVNAQGGHYGNALQAASQGGHDAIVRLLLEQGADVNLQGGMYGNALQAASLEGQNGIVRSLLEYGPDINAQGGRYGNALQAASLRGHDGIVRLLLAHGADVNAQGGFYGNALQAASERGHGAIVRLLLEQGADVQVQGGQCGNALHAASEGGHDGIVRLLLEKDVDVNAKGGWLGNALQAASLEGHDVIVALLLEHGADVNAQGGYYGNALQAASQGGHGAIVQLLVEQGVANAPGESYGNALEAASWDGHIAIVQWMLKHGADVHAHGVHYGNALQAASFRGHDVIVRLLLEDGADVNERGGWYDNALQAASLEGHDNIVRLLLEKGADANAQGGYYGNALQAASLEGHDTIVRLLLEQEADANAQGGLYENALQAASERGHDAIVRLLLERGAEVNATGGWLGNALHSASEGGHTGIVLLLLEKGADANAKGGWLGSALNVARHYDHKLIVQLLLENGAIVEHSEEESTVSSEE